MNTVSAKQIEGTMLCPSSARQRRFQTQRPRFLNHDLTRSLLTRALELAARQGSDCESTQGYSHCVQRLRFIGDMMDTRRACRRACRRRKGTGFSMTDMNNDQRPTHRAHTIECPVCQAHGAMLHHDIRSSLRYFCAQCEHEWEIDPADEPLAADPSISPGPLRGRVSTDTILSGVTRS